MTDERYTFVQDIREKKRTARGYYNKVRQGGRMKLPSDYLTEKERKNLSGQVYTYSLADRLTWEQFKGLPTDLQNEYIDKLRRNGGTAKDIKGFLNVSQHPFEAWCNANGVKFKRGKKSAIDKAKWAVFSEEMNVEVPEEQREQPTTEQKETLESLIEVIKALAGTGAKLTIEVTL